MADRIVGMSMSFEFNQCMFIAPIGRLGLMGRTGPMEEDSLQRDFTYGLTFLLIALGIATFSVRGGWCYIFIWPSLSFLVVASAYFLGDVRLYGKRPDGTRHWIATCLLLPYLALVYLLWSTHVVLSNEPAWNNVNESLVISRRLHAGEWPADVVLVCDLTCEFVDPAPIRNSTQYFCHPILDAGSAPANELIEFATRIPPPSQGRVLIHCARGHGRTAMFAAVWLAVHKFVTTSDEAVALLTNVRPGIRLRRRQRQAVIDAISKL